MVERISRYNDNQLLYEYTVNDPTVWTRPWSVATTFEKMDYQIYEYACHQGNHAIRNVLSGARYQEKRAAEKPANPVR